MRHRFFVHALNCLLWSHQHDTSIESHNFLPLQLLLVLLLYVNLPRVLHQLSEGPLQHVVDSICLGEAVVDPAVVTPNIAVVTAASLALCISWLIAPALLLRCSSDAPAPVSGGRGETSVEGGRVGPPSRF